MKSSNKERILWILALAAALLLAGCDESEDGDEELSLLSLATISGVLTDNNNGTIAQNTGLTWMKCVQGQVWNGGLNNCAGTGGGTVYGAVSLTFCAALTGNYADCTDANTVAPTATSGAAFDSCDQLSFAGFDDWRLPSQTELSGLLTTIQTRSNLLIWFPETPDDKFLWTGTGNPNESDGSEAYAYAVAENNFNTENTVRKDTVHYVRCVR